METHKGPHLCLNLYGMLAYLFDYLAIVKINRILPIMFELAWFGCLISSLRVLYMCNIFALVWSDQSFCFVISNMHLHLFRVKSQLKRIARPMYSNPPIHGARIVANVVGDPTLFNEWKQEMELMAGRIKTVRQKLYDSLTAKDKSGKDWSFILKQIGMFSFTGLNKAQVKFLIFLARYPRLIVCILIFDLSFAIRVTI